MSNLLEEHLEPTHHQFVETYKDSAGLHTFEVHGDFGSIKIKTNGFKGGDAGNGGFTEIYLEGYEAPARYTPSKWYDNGQVFKVRGDWELQQIIKSLEVLNKAMSEYFETDGWLP